MCKHTLQFFLLERRDAALIRWAHAVNSRRKLVDALTGPTHMLEADIILRGHDPTEPIMAHPPATDSDITLQQWLEGVRGHSKGIKLDFKSLDAVAPSLVLLKAVLDECSCPVWINADVLPGPGGKNAPLDTQAFLAALQNASRHAVLSLGWTTWWTAGADNPGYSWDMVHEMEQICRNLSQSVTFPVRAALLPQSLPQLKWLLQQSDRYTLTVWTGQNDTFRVEDLLQCRKEFDISRIYYDLPESQREQIAATLEDHH
ncbi:protein FAM151B isoform X2 [Genypterus blacodes]